MKRTALAVIMLLMFTGPAPAPILEQSYTDFARQLLEVVDAVAAANKLDKSDASRARRIAVQWILAGVCKGKGTDTKEGFEDTLGAVEFVLNANPARPFHAAVLQMIVMLNLDDFGRGSNRVCRFAREMAVPFVRVP